MPEERVEGEEAIVQEFLAPLAAGYPGALGLADDCATIRVPAGEEIVVKTDPVVSGIHFLPDADPADIAWRALAVNVSDLAAKGATPLAYLMALALPEAPRRAWIGRLASGLREAQEAFGCHLIGGDTDRVSGPLTISITVFGRVPEGRMVRRGTARPGDAILVTGTLGDGALGLELLTGRACGERLGLNAGGRQELISRFLRPIPRLAAREVLRAHATAAMDISDGLAKDLGRMCRASGAGAVVQAAAVPLSAPFQRALGREPRLITRALAAGDDYEVLLTMPAEAVPRAIAEAAAAGLRLTRIGEITRGSGVSILSAGGAPIELAVPGWEHFAAKS